MFCRLAVLCLLFVSNLALGSDVIDGADGAQYHTGLLKDHQPHGKLHFKLSHKLGTAPASLDYRTQGFVSQIKNQGSCGSCWAFAITKTLESARLKAGLSELNLGEQEMVSCDDAAYGCSGGMMSDADYIVKRGLPLESDYPYTASDSRCKSTLPAVADKAKSWAYIGQEGRAPTVQELKDALDAYGPLFVTVSAGGSDWDGSAIHMSRCRNSGTNHMVTLVGYNENNEFIIGNSWGADWAENGFAYAKQGCDELASDTEGAAFIVYEGSPVVPPSIRLPAEITVAMGTTIPLGVKLQSGVVYKWYLGTALVGSGHLLWISPTADVVYKLVATSAAGTAESSVQIKVLTGGIK